MKTHAQVAEFLLKRLDPKRVRGVVFLDDRDRKMVLVRSTMRAVELEDSGIGPEQRFAFYDQVHTTGMDIKHTHDAVAVLTLGKDMVLRDYAQGAYRMRGIAKVRRSTNSAHRFLTFCKGQRIHLLLIPEVRDLIRRELALAGELPQVSSDQALLRDVMAWLVINACRSERLQYNQLQIQNVCNVWRRRAFDTLQRDAEVSVEKD